MRNIVILIIILLFVVGFFYGRQEYTTYVANLDKQAEALREKAVRDSLESEELMKRLSALDVEYRRMKTNYKRMKSELAIIRSDSVRYVVLDGDTVYVKGDK
jgi:septation ring formation regulator EzrA